jgi:membrane protein DedA with SNARE-associated domain
MEQFIETSLRDYGPFAVFFLLMLSGFGLPLGEEMVTIPAGVLVATGRMDLTSTVVLAYVAICSADLLWYAICRHYGTPLLHRRMFKRLLHPRRILQLKHQLDQRGAWVVITARFIPSSRTAAITVAGLFQMPFWKFAAATLGCAVITVPLQIGLGFLIGQGMDSQKGVVELLYRILGIVALITVLSLLLTWWTQARASRRPMPRARAAWLRRFRVPARLHRRAKRPGDSDEPAPKDRVSEPEKAAAQADPKT